MFVSGVIIINDILIQLKHGFAWILHRKIFHYSITEIKKLSFEKFTQKMRLNNNIFVNFHHENVKIAINMDMNKNIDETYVLINIFFYRFFIFLT